MRDPIPFGTPAWCAALREEVNASSEYRNAAAKWGVGFNGNLLLDFEADGGLSAPLHLFLALAGGRCDRAEFVAGRAHAETGFSLRAPFSLWREILERRTLAATAILTGKMKVEGDKLTLLKHAGANRALIHCVASVPTEFPSPR
ncbi:MAG TPA: SCP2 sterol-binding domain-containing protein [Candidatus Eisenbacteria bacterium]|nr:SCP2 sterol-binding domain-containing protein [Candidatus Eisenbacteria bacterium]